METFVGLLRLNVCWNKSNCPDGIAAVTSRKRGWCNISQDFDQVDFFSQLVKEQVWLKNLPRISFLEP